VTVVRRVVQPVQRAALDALIGLAVTVLERRIARALRRRREETSQHR
jgi:hypothetical protein